MIITRRNFLTVSAGAITAQALGAAGFESKIVPIEINLGLKRQFKLLHSSNAILDSMLNGSTTAVSRITEGVNFVAFNNAEQNVSAADIAAVSAEFDKPYPIVLVCQLPPFYTANFMQKAGLKKNVWEMYDQKTRDFYTWIQTKSQLKAILCGHLPIAEIDGFSETSKMYVAGANSEGIAYEITFK